MPKRKEINVSQGFMSKYKTITQALNAAERGDVIKIKPGVYRESLQINKDVMIIGDGAASEVIIESTAGDCIVAKDRIVHLHRLTINQMNEDQGYKALNFDRTEFLLTDCIITSKSDSAIFINNCSDFAIRETSFEDCVNNGIIINDHSKGVIENCYFTRTRNSPALWIGNGSDPLIKNCTIIDSNQHAVVIDHQGRGTFENCHIMNTKIFSVNILNQGNPTFRNCKISNGQSHGISAINGGGVFEDCEIDHFNVAPIILRNRSNVSFTHCHLHHGDSNAIITVEESKGIFEKCEISAFQKVALVVVNSTPVFSNCTISEGSGNAAMIQEGATPTFNQCKFSDFQSDMIVIESLSNPVFNSCEFSNQRSPHHAGIKMGLNGFGTFKDCVISNFGYNIWIENQSKGTFENCSIQGALNRGVLISQATAEFKKCTLANFPSESLAAFISQGDNILFSDCKITAGEGNGISFANGSTGAVVNCDFSDFSQPALVLNTNSKVNVSNTHIHDGAGVYFEKASGSLENCEIYRCTNHAMIIKDSNPYISKCRIYDGQAGGAFFLSHASGIVDECEFWGFSSDVAIVINEGSDPSISNCMIRDSKSNGVVVRNNGFGKIENCKVYNIVQPAIAAIFGGAPTVLNTEVYDCYSHAVLVDQGGKGTFKDCNLHSIKSDGINIAIVSNNSEASFINTNISNGTNNGLYVSENSKVLMDHCTVHDTKAPCIFVRGEAIITDSTIYNSSNGIVFNSTKGNRIENCKLYGFKDPAIALMDFAETTITNVAISNSNYGLLLKNHSKAQLKNIEFDSFDVGMIVVRENSSIDIEGGTFSKAQECAILLEDRSSALLTNCIFTENNKDVIADETSRYDIPITPSTGDGLKNNHWQDYHEHLQQKVSENTKEVISVRDETQTDFDIAKELNEFVGLNNIKAKVKETIQLLNITKRRRELGLEAPIDLSMNHMVFYGNPGTGKTSVARMIGKLYKDLGVLEEGHVVEVNRELLVGQHIGHSEEKTANKLKEAEGGILFIDEAYTLASNSHDSNDFGRQVIDTLLPRLENNNGNFICIVSGYEKQMKEFLNSNPGLSSRFKEYYHFEDFTPDEMLEIAKITFAKKHYSIDESVAALLYKEFVRLFRSKDEHFGNARTVVNLCEKIIIAQAKRLSTLQLDLSKEELITIIADDIISALSKDEIQRVDIPINEELLAQQLGHLNSLVGLTTVKEKINQLIELVRYYKEEGKDLSTLTMHILLLGNPGTGKTEVAKIIGKIYQALGVLERGNVIEVSRDSLVDKYRGGTEEKTSKLIDDTMGGTLFIDEAYTLTNKSADDPGHVAVEVLLKKMEDNRGRFIVLAAGYQEEMELFLDSNKGLRRRFDQRFIFEDYSPNEMLEITMKVVQAQGYTMTNDAQMVLLDHYALQYENRTKTYGNAGMARNIGERAIKNLDYRFSQIPVHLREETLKYTIQAIDLEF